MRVACWVPTKTISEYVMLIAFPVQQMLHERASILRHMYRHCLSFDVSLTVHHSIDFSKYQLSAQFF